MEDVRSSMEEHMNMMMDMVQKVSVELSSGFTPAYDNFMASFRAIDWKEPWLICLLSFHVLLLLATVLSRKHINFQMCLFLFALSGVYFAEILNELLCARWRMFSAQNYFDTHGLFLSVVWSAPLLVIALIILINTLFSLCHLIVQWKRAQLRHRARLSQKKDN